jgi:hypothetical protein
MYGKGFFSIDLYSLRRRFVARADAILSLTGKRKERNAWRWRAQLLNNRLDVEQELRHKPHRVFVYGRAFSNEL